MWIQKIKRFVIALLVSLGVTVLWIVFFRITLLGLLYWYPSAGMNIAMLGSLVLPALFYGGFERRKHEKINTRFLLASLAAAVLILLLMPEQTERMAVGLLILPIVLVLFLIDLDHKQEDPK